MYVCLYKLKMHLRQLSYIIEPTAFTILKLVPRSMWKSDVLIVYMFVCVSAGFCPELSEENVHAEHRAWLRGDLRGCVQYPRGKLAHTYAKGIGKVEKPCTLNMHVVYGACTTVLISRMLRALRTGRCSPAWPPTPRTPNPQTTRQP